MEGSFLSEPGAGGLLTRGSLGVAPRHLTLYGPNLRHGLGIRSKRVGRCSSCAADVHLQARRNVLILAMFAPAGIVGYDASGEKVSKAIVGLLLADSRRVLSETTGHLAAHSAEGRGSSHQDQRLLEIGAGVIRRWRTFAGAHTYRSLVFGADVRSQPCLSCKSWLCLPFIVSLSDAIGLQSLLPAGKESLVMIAIVAGGFVTWHLR